MKIVILDRCTVTNGDVSLEEIECLGETKSYDLISDEEIKKVAADADVIISNKATIGEDIMAACHNLKYIGLFATGYNNIDLKAANKYGISVVNVPGYSTQSVATLTISMLLEFATSMSLYNKSVHEGGWVRSKQFSYFPFPMVELSDKTIGIFGFGNIGSKVADIAHAFGMRVISYTRSEKQSDFVEFVSKDEIFKQSDFLTFHCPLNDETRGIVNRDTLKTMKNSAYIIDVARGAIIVEDDLVWALNNDVIAGAAIDTLETEPMRENHPYLSTKNCIMTPHVGWAAIETRRRLVTLVAENLKSFIEGNPINVVN